MFTFPTVDVCYWKLLERARWPDCGQASVMHAKVARWRQCWINCFSCLKFCFCLTTMSTIMIIIQWNLSIVNSHGTQKNVHYTEVFTQEGWDMFMYTCACNTLKTVPSLLVRSSLGGRAIFQTVFLSFYILWFFWIFYESTCISYRLIVYHSSSIHSRRLDVHTMNAICKLNGIWPFHWSTTVMIGRQTKHYQPGTVLSSWECEIPSHYGPWPGRCEDKPSPACEHAVPIVEQSC